MDIDNSKSTRIDTPDLATLPSPRGSTLRTGSLDRLHVSRCSVLYARRLSRKGSYESVRKRVSDQPLLRCGEG